MLQKDLIVSGIQVRQDLTSYLMHHKFVILDENLLITGSFNWTRQAITGNNENLIVTNQPELLCAYQDEFEKLWTMYDPRNSATATTCEQSTSYL